MTDYEKQENELNLEAIKGSQADGIQVSGNRNVLNIADKAAIAAKAEYMRNEIIGLEKNAILSGSVFNCNEENYNTWTLTVFLQIGNWIGSLGKFSDKVLEDLEIRQYKLIELLVQNGALAIVKLVDNLYAVPYIVSEYDIYGEPTKIKAIPCHAYVNGKHEEISSKNLTDHEFNKEDFAILYLSPDKLPTILKNIGYLSAWYSALCKLNQSVDTVGTKLYHDPGESNGKKDLLQEQENDWIQGPDNVLIVQKGRGPNGRTVEDVRSERLADSFVIFNTYDNRDGLEKTAQYFKNCFYEVLGISFLDNPDKQERRTNVEIASQQDLAGANKEMFIKTIEESIDLINKKFNCNWTYERTKEDDEQWDETTETNFQNEEEK